MKYFFYLFFFLLFISKGFSQENYTISGKIKDISTGEDLSEVNVSVDVDGQNRGVISNAYGFYSLRVPKGKCELKYSSVGYEIESIEIDVNENKKLDVFLVNQSQTLQEVEFEINESDIDIYSVESGVSRLTTKEIETIPVVFGEKDILKTIQLLPNVKTLGEGSTGFFVRGGSEDQNLVLLDEAPVYNTSHLLGFFSVFNSDAIKSMKLYSGYIPAKFGGRLSSVLDVRMKEGNLYDYDVSGSIGLISSKLTVEGPIKKEKGSFIVSGRRTYADIFLGLTEDFDDNTLYFYDLNAKANYEINENNRIFFSGYLGRDELGLGNDFGFDWGNETATLRWSHIWNDNLFQNTSLIYSKFDYAINLGDGAVGLGADLRDYNLKTDFDYYLNEKHQLSFGGNVIYHIFEPGTFTTGAGENSFDDVNIDDKFALESSLYIGNEQKINENLTLNYSLRYTNFTQFGQGTVFTFNNEGEAISEREYSRGEVVESYHNLEPRFGASYVLNNNSSLKTAYFRTVQNLHLMSNSTSSAPVDLWLPSSNNIKPQTADQISLGYFRDFGNKKYQFSLEGYYKWMNNSIDFRAGADLVLNEEIEGDLLFGRGRAYGLEFLLKKNKGKLTGWFSYSWARSQRKIEGINRGEWYNAKQDRIHDLSLVGIYKLSPRIDLSGTFVYSTGNATTFPNGTVEIDGLLVNTFGDRNQNRMPDFHRLDFGMTLKPKKERIEQNQGKKFGKRKVESTWNFSIYNVYGRENAYFIEFEEGVASQTALFSIIPSVSWNFRF